MASIDPLIRRIAKLENDVAQLIARHAASTPARPQPGSRSTSLSDVDTVTPPAHPWVSESRTAPRALGRNDDDAKR